MQTNTFELLPGKVFTYLPHARLQLNGHDLPSPRLLLKAFLNEKRSTSDISDSYVYANNVAAYDRKYCPGIWLKGVGWILNDRVTISRVTEFYRWLLKVSDND